MKKNLVKVSLFLFLSSVLIGCNRPTDSTSSKTSTVTSTPVSTSTSTSSSSSSSTTSSIASSSSSSSSEEIVKRQLTINNIQGASLTSDKESYAEGETVNLTLEITNTSLSFSKFVLSDTSIQINVSEESTQTLIKASFVMPNKDLTISYELIAKEYKVETISNFSPDYIGNIEIDGKTLEKEFTFTGESEKTIKVYPSTKYFASSDKDKVYLHINDKVYKPSLAEPTDETNSSYKYMEVKVKMPSENASIRVIKNSYNEFTSDYSTPYSVTIKADEHVDILGYSATEKYTDFKLYANRIKGYRITEVKYKTTDATEWTTSDLSSLNYKVENGLLALTIYLYGDTEIEITTTKDDSYKQITYTNTENVDFGYNVSLIDYAYTDESVKYSYSGKNSYLIESKPTITGVSYSSSTTSELTIDIENENITVSFNVIKGKQVIIKENANIKQAFVIDSKYNKVDALLANQKYSLIVEPLEGYKPVSMTVENGEKIEFSTYFYGDYEGSYYADFTMLDKDIVNIEVEVSKAYTVKATSSKGITFTPETAIFAKGEQAYIGFELDSGYRLTANSFKIKNHDEIKLNVDEEVGSITFTMPEENVELVAEVEPIPTVSLTVEEYDTSVIQSIYIQGNDSKTTLESFGTNSNFFDGEKLYRFEVNIDPTSATTPKKIKIVITYADNTSITKEAEVTTNGYADFVPYGGEDILIKGNTKIKITAE